MNELIARAFADMPHDAWPLPVGRAFGSALWHDHGNANLALGMIVGAGMVLALNVLVLTHAAMASRKR